MLLPITERQKEMLAILYNYIKDTGYPPTYIEMRERLGIKSNQSVIDLLYKLEEKKLIKRQNGARSIAILPLGYQALDKEPLVPFLGITHAGSPITTVAIEGEWHKLPGEVAKFGSDVFLLRVSGDSMINAGINDGDVVLVQSVKEFSSGDIVLADIDGDSTIKRFVSEDKPPYLYLKPENPNHKVIFITERVTMKGKVISILSKGQWTPAS
jgi:repressor LexA